MNLLPPGPDCRGSTGRLPGFSLLELLFTAGIAALVLATAVIVYGAMVSARSNRDARLTIDLGETIATHFYDLDESQIQVWTAPNFGRAAVAEELREVFLDDLAGANAVFCLSRTTHDSLRPTTLSLTGVDPSRLDTPDAFLTLLNSLYPAATGLHTPYRGAAPEPNLSLFMLEPSPAATELAVRAIYELDLVEMDDPAGTYASVRRYVGGTITAYYDIFYPESDLAAAFLPVTVMFERRNRLALDEGDEVNAFKQAADRPFYFVWWPDPSRRFLEDSTINLALPSSDPRSFYSNMGNRSAFFFVLPMFPSL